MRSRDVFNLLNARCTACGYVRITPDKFSWEWKDACSRIMALCEDLRIDPRLYVESIVQTVGWWCSKSQLTLLPRHVYGANAGRRYNEWLDRARQKVASATMTRIESRTRDRNMEAETLYVDIYGAMQSMPHATRHRFASRSARESFRHWSPCRLRRTCALANHFHQLDATLPDILVLTDSWTTAGIFTVVERML